MRPLIAAGCVAVLWACATTPAAPPAEGVVDAGMAEAAPPAPAPRLLEEDTPLTTARGNTFIAPAGWTVTEKGPATVLEAPEGDSRLVLVDVKAADAAAAVTAAWQAVGTEPSWPVLMTNPVPARDGWSEGSSVIYRTSPNEKRGVQALARQANDVWTVALYDMADAVGEKRGAQVSLVLGRLLPAGYSRESFAGKTAAKLDAARVAQLEAFVELAMKELKVPGVAVGLVQDGKTVFAGGFGVKELGKKGAPDADTLFMVASNTKALTTLLLGKLVDEGKVGWDTPVVDVLESFKLGDEAVTRKVQVKHLICACTGLPRQDFEWLFQFKGVTPAGAMATLGTMMPTSEFGELFQYSNPMAAAGGFVGGHLFSPGKELGAAYDAAMKAKVFDPLGMKATTFDYARALKGNHAEPHAPDIDGAQARAAMDINYSIIPVRPAGAAWSSVNDMLKYVSMELARGTLPGGKRYVSEAVLEARQAPQVWIGKDTSYGMGLSVSRTYGVTEVYHGGDMIGFHSDMMWFPDAQVGAVVLTNGDPGWVLRTQFRRKLLEVLYDGKDQAEPAVKAAAKAFYDAIAAERALLTVPADPGAVEALARQYRNPALGEITVVKDGSGVTFDVGEWKTRVATKKNPDGTLSFVTTSPGVSGFDLVVGAGPPRTLTVRDAQHEYVFSEVEATTAR